MAGKKSNKNPSVQSQDEKIGKIEATLDYVREDLAVMNAQMKIMSETLAVNTEQLKVHIEGVKLAREQNELIKKDVEVRFEALRKDVEIAEEKVESKIEPIQAHVTKVQTLGKVGTWLAGAVLVPALGWGVVKLFELIFR